MRQLAQVQFFFDKDSREYMVRILFFHQFLPFIIIFFTHLITNMLLLFSFHKNCKTKKNHINLKMSLKTVKECDQNFAQFIRVTTV